MGATLLTSYEPSFCTLHPQQAVGPAKPRAPWRLALEDGELMPEGENLRFELKTRANGGPEGGQQSYEQSQHAGRERYQPSAQICSPDKRFPVSGRDRPGGYMLLCFVCLLYTSDAADE